MKTKEIMCWVFAVLIFGCASLALVHRTNTASRKCQHHKTTKQYQLCFLEEIQKK